MTLRDDVTDGHVSQLGYMHLEITVGEPQLVAMPWSLMQDLITETWMETTY